MQVRLVIAYLLLFLWSTVARSQDDRLDTLQQSSPRSSFALAVGMNLWQENPGPPGGTGTFSILFGLWRELWGQLDLGAWTQRGLRPFFRAGVAAHYRIPITTGVYVYPKAGAAFVFALEFLWSIGCGASYQFSRKFEVFLEAGQHIAHRESQIRANYYPLAAYLNVGLIIRSVR
jgi:hypothetical protein